MHRQHNWVLLQHTGYVIERQTLEFDPEGIIVYTYHSTTASTIIRIRQKISAGVSAASEGSISAL